MEMKRLNEWSRETKRAAAKATKNIHTHTHSHSYTHTWSRLVVVGIYSVEVQPNRADKKHTQQINNNYIRFTQIKKKQRATVKEKERIEPTKDTKQKRKNFVVYTQMRTSWKWSKRTTRGSSVQTEWKRMYTNEPTWTHTHTRAQVHM